VASLRDADLAMVERAGAELDDDARRRAVHVISENARVLETRRALADGDLATVGRLFGESHASLRDLYEVSSFELDTLVGIAASTPGVLAARLTGAGFGGCTVNLVEPGAEGALEAAVAERYQAATGRVARVWAVQPADGAGMVADA
jgi:galactokinase